MQPRCIIPGTAGAAARSWLFNGAWRGSLAGAATPVLGAGLMWAGSLWSTPKDPSSMSTAGSLTSGSPSEVVSYLAAIAMYSILAMSIGSVAGLLLGMAIGAVAAMLDVATGCRIRPPAIAGVVIVSCAAGTWWAITRLDPGGPVVPRLAAMTPFLVGTLFLVVVRIERRSGGEALEQQFG